MPFRYGSRYVRDFGSNQNLIEHDNAASLSAQFARAAQAFAKAAWSAAEAVRSLYTLDAMVDAEGSASFLEMNCNPIVHPAGYAAMLREGERKSPESYIGPYCERQENPLLEAASRTAADVR